MSETLSSKLFEISKQRPILEAKLRESIARLVSHEGNILSIELQEHLFRLLTEVPKWILMDEIRVLEGKSANFINSYLPDFNDEEKSKAAILKMGRFYVWDNLTKNQKDDSRRAWKRFYKQRVAFAEGRPNSNNILVISFMEAIEKVSGKPFTFTYDSYSDGNKLKGNMMETLVNALDLALFASGAPSTSTLRDINLRRHQEPHIK